MSDKWYKVVEGKKPSEVLCEGWLCPFCGLIREKDFRPDPCLGELPGVEFACCGHGGMVKEERGYIAFSNGVVLRFGHAGTVDGVTR